MRIEAEVAGRAVVLDTFDDPVSVGAARAILTGETYPLVPGLGEIRTVVDIGANVGATSVYFAHLLPSAQVHSFEPAAATFERLAGNVAGLANVTAHHVGLYDRAERTTLFHGAVGPGQASILPGGAVTDQGEEIELRDAGAELDRLGIDHVDVLKVDTEGCELPILRSLGDRLAGVKALYAEFHSHQDWRAMDALLAETHVLGAARMFFHQGEVVYVRADLLPGLRGG